MLLETVLRRAPKQVSCALRDESAVLNLATGTYFGLDPVASFIWARLDAPHSLQELRDALMAEYDVSARQCELDLARFAKELCDAGLAEVVDESPDGPSPSTDSLAGS